MGFFKLYFATNRNHESSGAKKGTDEGRWTPDGYGGGFSSTGRQNLRFGKIEVPYSEEEVSKYLTKQTDGSIGDGEGLSEYFKEQVGQGKIEAFKDHSHLATKASIPFEEASSTKAFTQIKQRMETQPGTDVLIFVHGFNVTWTDAVASAISLEIMLNRGKGPRCAKEVMVVLFSWPSNRAFIPFLSYWNDSKDSADSGTAVARAILKLHGFLTTLREKADNEAARLCQQNIHLLCHSRGNFLLQNAMETLIEESPKHQLARIFKHIFMCAADVDDNILEDNKPLELLPRTTHDITIYYNNGDLAMAASEKTKGNDDRLGQTGVANETKIHRKVHQVDCSSDITGFVEHSYYLWGHVTQDIRMTIDDLPFDARSRNRKLTYRNSWVLTSDD